MILIALGANVSSAAGEPIRTLRAGLAELSQNGVKPLSVSQAYQTPAWPNPADPPFVNAAAAVETALAPAELMTLLHSVEKSFGRVRTVPNAPRPLDLDLIDYDGQTMSGIVELPHPRMQTRGFVLVPLADVAPDWKHPVSGQALSELIAALNENERAEVVPIGSLWP